MAMVFWVKMVSSYARKAKILLNQDRIDDLQRAIEDSEYREDLYKEFEI